MIEPITHPTAGAASLSAAEPAYRINGTLSHAAAFYRVACDPHRSVAVEACAGAGKTWMLVSRIVRALLDGCAPHQILAITFTKKAAGEMRQRLLDLLDRCAQASDTQLVDELVLRGVDAADAQRLAPDLRGLQARLMAHGRPVQVRTFHSWFAALLRVAPLAVLQELHIPVQYELLEDDSQAVREVWPRFFARVAANESLQGDFVDSVAAYGRSATLSALEAALSKRVEFVLADQAGVVDASVPHFHQTHPHWAGHDDPAHALLGADAAQRWHARAAALGAEANKTPRNAADQVVSAFLLPDAPNSARERLAALRKAFFVADEDRLKQHLSRYEAAQAAEQALLPLLQACRQHDAWAHQQRMARLTRTLVMAYRDVKRERGWVDMNDIELAAQRLLGDASLAPWMQQRLDAQVRHLLIDEFQDTNPLQWQALHAWLSAYAGAGSGEAPRVFVVGDPKQSIYRFRRAEPQVFQAAQRFVREGLGGDLLSCDHTRRCAPAVVDALNAVMGQASEAGDYQGFRPHTTSSHAPGWVTSLPVVARTASETAGTDDAWRDSLHQPKHLPQDSPHALEARQVADWIAARIASGHFRAQDVMVLARKRERLGWLHDALRERGIPSDEPEQRELGEVPAVQDIVALLDALVSPSQDVSLARALKSPLFGWDDEALATLAARVRDATQADQVPNWWDTLMGWADMDEATETHDRARPPEPVRDAAQRLRRYRAWVHQWPPHDALAAIYRDADVWVAYARITPPALRAQVLSHLHAVLTAALAQEGGRSLTAYRLVRAFRAGGIAAPVVASPSAVRLLTVHGAKGLESPVVVLLDTDAVPARASSMGVLVDWPGEQAVPTQFVFLVSEKRPPASVLPLLEREQQARALEELNGLYVAITRAETRLVVSACEPHGDSGLSWYRRLCAVAADEAWPLAPETSTERPTQLPAQRPADTADPPSAAPAPAPAPALRPPAGLPFKWLELPALCWQAPADAISAVDDNPLSARMGQAMHRLLQWCPTPLGDFAWEAHHLRSVGRAFDLTPSEVEQVRHHALAIVAGEARWAWDTEWVDWWDNEVELLDANGQVQRLDRLVRRRDTGDWWVLDHKTAERPDSQPALREQLIRYAQAVALAWPGQTVRTAFLTAQGRLIECAWSPDASPSGYSPAHD